MQRSAPKRIPKKIRRTEHIYSALCSAKERCARLRRERLSRAIKQLRLSLFPYRFKLFRMKRTLALLVALLLCLSPGFAQDWAKQKLDKSPRHGEWVPIKHDNRTVQAFVVYPEIKAKAPVVIVIHEIYGLTDWARSVADQLAANGYIAIAPDLLSGMGPKGGGTIEFSGPQDAGKAISGLNPDQVTADLNATADYAKKIPASNGNLAGAGFSWGGGQAFRL